jgi:hypothetical protein
MASMYDGAMSMLATASRSRSNRSRLIGASSRAMSALRARSSTSRSARSVAFEISMIAR